MSISSLSLLNIPDTHSLSSTNKIPFQTITTLNATANPCQTLYQPHTAPNMGLSATLPSSISSVTPINPSPAITQNYNVLFLTVKKSVIFSDGLNHQYTPEKQLHQNDAHMIFTMGKQPLGLVAIKYWHKRKKAYIQCSLCGIASSFFCHFTKIAKVTGVLFYLHSKNNFFQRKLHITHKLKLKL